MGRDELVAALRRQTEEKIASLREEAQTKARDIRKEREDRLSRLQEELAATRREAARVEAEVVLRQADGEIRDRTLQTEREISERLYRIAVGLLPDLRDENDGKSFRSLSEELPPFQWSTVRVNPADVDDARALFPDADVTGDKAISGGLEAGSDGDRVRIVNTFEKRLERAWEELLPILLRDVEAST